MMSQAKKKITTAIIIVVVILILVIALVYYFILYKDYGEVGKTTNTNTEQQDWLIYRYGNYTFDYPGDWEKSEMVDGVVPFSVNNEEVAELLCPFLETGYEGYEGEDYTRKILKNATEHEILLSNMTKSDEKVSLLIFRPEDVTKWSSGCQLFSRDIEDMFNIYNRIYNSIR